MPLLRRTLWTAAAVVGTIVAARMLFGPLNLFGIAVNAPLNPEGVFGLLVVLLWTTFTPEAIWTLQLGPHRKERMWPWVALTLGAFAAIYPALSVYFVSDDFILLKQAQNLDWGVFSVAGGDGFFRPLGYVSLAVNSWFAGIDSRIWHFSALTLHIANSVLVGLLVRRAHATLGVSLVAASLFALHGTHLEAAVWIAGRFDLLATFFTLLTMMFYGANLPVAMLCALGALWSKESAYVLPVLLLVWGRHVGASWKSSLPFAELTASAFLYRVWLLGGIGGYHDDSGDSAFFSLKLATTAKAVFIRLWTSLFFPINWSEDPPVWVGVLAAAYICALLWIARRGAPKGQSWLLLMLGISILPPLHLLGGAADLSGGRLLYLPSVWFCWMLAYALAWLPKREFLIVSTVFVAFHFAAMRHDLRFWVEASENVRTICEQAARGQAPQTLPRDLNGVPALANGFAECVELSGRLQ